MKKLVLILFAGILAVSAHTQAVSAHAQTDTTHVTTDTVRDGSSYEKAVVIRSTNEDAAVHDEYQWIRDHFPAYDPHTQKLFSHKGIPYDVLTIRNGNGVTKTLYFDISRSYGRM